MKIVRMFGAYLLFYSSLLAFICCLYCCGPLDTHEESAFVDSSNSVIRSAIKIPGKTSGKLSTSQIPDPPVECSTRALKEAYQFGYSLGWRRASKIARRYSCDQIEQFSNRLSSNVYINDTKYGVSGSKNRANRMKRQCRLAGSIEGVYAILDYAFEYCGTQCIQQGDITGKVSAETYCDITIKTGGIIEIEEWVRGSINYCGANFELACDSTYRYTSTSYLGGSCEIYTEGDYFSQWDNYRLKFCDYSRSTRKKVARPRFVDDEN